METREIIIRSSRKPGHRHDGLVTIKGTPDGRGGLVARSRAGLSITWKVGA
jgi:hypothetical protein